MSSGAQRLEESDLPGAGVIGVCEPPDWGVLGISLGPSERASSACS